MAATAQAPRCSTQRAGIAPPLELFFRRAADVAEVDDVVRILAYQGIGQRAILPEN